MTPRIDSESIRVTATADPAIFHVEFDFTDDTTTNPTLGYTLIWHRARFDYNTTMGDAKALALASAAIQAARRPAPEATLEVALRTKFGTKFGTAFVRADPDPPEPAPIKVVVVAG